MLGAIGVVNTRNSSRWRCRDGGENLRQNCRVKLPGFSLSVALLNHDLIVQRLQHNPLN